MRATYSVQDLKKRHVQWTRHFINFCFHKQKLTAELQYIKSFAVCFLKLQLLKTRVFAIIFCGSSDGFSRLRYLLFQCSTYMCTSILCIYSYSWYAIKVRTIYNFMAIWFVHSGHDNLGKEHCTLECRHIITEALKMVQYNFEFYLQYVEAWLCNVYA